MRPRARCLRVLVVIAHQEVGVALGRRGARAKMQHGPDARRSRRRPIARASKLVGVDVVGEPQRNEVPPLFGFVQPIDDQNVVETATIQCPNQRAANEACAARDDDRAAREVVHNEAHYPA